MNLGIIIVWPKNKNFKNIIVSELISNRYKILKYQKITVYKNYIKNILREIHYGKKWWDDNLENEYLKRVDKNNEQLLQYFIVEKENIHLVLKGFKKSIREKYNLDKSYFHISDPDCFNHLGKNCNCKCDKIQFNIEFEKHLDFFTNIRI